MANLFVVHTPLCLFVAQNIIRQENLKDNILLIRKHEDSKGFDEGYRLLKIPEYWSDARTLEDSRKWKSNPIKTSITYISNERKLMRLIKELHVTQIFYGDLNDLRYRLEFLRMKSLGIRVSLYEEGMSHYIIQEYLSNKKIVYASILFDSLIRFPILCLSYLKYRNLEIFDFIQKIISTRYSILPQMNPTPMDKVLKIKKNYSQELSRVIETTRKSLEEININNAELVLYASQPLFNRPHVCDHIIKQVISNVLCSKKEFLKDKLIVIKHHPRETQKDKIEIQRIFKDNGLNYCVLQTHQAVPLEVFLQSIRFNSLIAYSSSCIAYSGYSYEYAPVILFIQDYKKALEKEEGLENRDNFILETVGFVKYFDFLNNIRNESLKANN